MSDELQTLVLKGSEWWRGNSSIGSALIVQRNVEEEPEGMCCLGIALCAFHVGHHIKPQTHKYPHQVPLPLVSGPCEKAREFQDKCVETATLAGRAHEVAGRPMDTIERLIGTINDHTKIDDKERVKLLEPLFNKLGLTLDFRPDE